MFLSGACAAGLPVHGGWEVLSPSRRSSAVPPPKGAVSRRGHGGCFAMSKQNDVCWSHAIAVERKGLGMSKERRARSEAAAQPLSAKAGEW